MIIFGEGPLTQEMIKTFFVLEIDFGKIYFSESYSEYSSKFVSASSIFIVKLRVPDMI
jgi:hypothetical protein